MISNWTFKDKNSYQQALKQLVLPLRQQIVANEFSGLRLGTSGAVYDQQRVEMEALIRPLWGLSALWCGNENDIELQRAYHEKIIKGTDPESPYYWGAVEDYDQYIVEMAAISLYLLLNKKTFWDPISELEKHNLSGWLSQALSRKIPKNNWTFFKILIRVALFSCGLQLDRENLAQELGLIDQMYIGEGWYVDGKTSQKDYYIPFAFHYYGLIYSVFMKEEDPKYAQKFRERASCFAEQYTYYFDDDGEAIPFGRSLTYRFAQGAFLSALVFADVEALPWGQIKYLLNQHMRNWMQYPIFTVDGRLSIGYHYENLVMAEGYNAPGSPYWAFKTFLILATPDQHPFWKVNEEKVVREEQQLIRKGSMLITQSLNQNHVLGYPVGLMVQNQAHASAKYSKFVYSTKFGFSVPKSNGRYEEGAFDNVLAVSLDGVYFYSKEESKDDWTSERGVGYEWSPFSELVIRTEIYPFGEWHIRVHHVSTTVPVVLKEGGFSVPLIHKNANSRIEKNSAQIISEEYFSQIVSIEGYENAAIVYPEPNTSLFFPRSVFPILNAKLIPGEHQLMCLVGGVFSREDEKNDSGRD